MPATVETPYVERRAARAVCMRAWRRRRPLDEDAWPAPPETVVWVGAPEIADGGSFAERDRAGDLPFSDAVHVKWAGTGMTGVRIETHG